MKSLSAEELMNVAGGWDGAPWYGPFEVYRPGQAIDPTSPWAPPVPGYPF